MSVIFGDIKLARSGWTPRPWGLLFDRYRHDFQTRRQRARLRNVLVGLADRELRDIGLSRGEIEHVAGIAAAGHDPRPVGSPAAGIGGGR